MLFAGTARDAFREIRNYLAGRLLGATRDEALLQEVVKCLFCKMHLERVPIAWLEENDALQVMKRYRQAFDAVKAHLPTVFSEDDEILLDPASLLFVHQAMRNIELHSASYDPFGDVYEVFTGNGARGQEGQFFTPQNAVNFLVEVVNPQPGERIIDPACGSGAFLSAVTRHLIRAGTSPQDAVASVFGVDKDSYLSRLATARLSLPALQMAQVYTADSLALQDDQGQSFALSDELGQFDVVLANPPFGARIVAASKEVQAAFDLGYKWKPDRARGRYVKSSELQTNVPPQVLFIERLLSFARPGGRLGIVVPESLVSSVSYRHVIQYMQDHAHIMMVVGMPEALFKTSGKGGTHTKTCLLVLEKKEKPTEPKRSIFMAEAKWCGRDSRGRDIDKDELPDIIARWHQARRGESIPAGSLGYIVAPEQLVEDTLAPRYYGFDAETDLADLSETHDLVSVGHLIEQGLLKITTGDEVGKLHYGSGSIPFVRTSDISTWEIKIDPKHGVSEEVYESLAAKQDVQAGDILMVRDGTYLIGKCALITSYDTRIVFQSHIYKLRSIDHERLSPYLLLAAFGSEPVIRQIKARSYTQDIIDTLGNRIVEIVLPIPKDAQRREQVIRTVEKVIQERIEARELARQACLDIVQP
ncbi:MAG: N-6 DNA methylase [Anaerolineae bacterium]|nr:N-6 DNA methylase [Anaerolineae bacterium]